MESLGDILRRVVTARDIRRTTNGDRRPRLCGAGAEPEEPAAPSCRVCGDAGWVSKRVPVGHPDFGEAFPCRCQQQQDPISRAEALRRYSNLGALGSISLAETNPAGNSDHPAEQRMFEDALSRGGGLCAQPQRLAGLHWAEREREDAPGGGGGQPVHRTGLHDLLHRGGGPIGPPAGRLRAG